jgi:hypothetical protein
MGEQLVANREDPAVNPVEATSRHPISRRPPAEPYVCELAYGDDSVLASR